MSNFDSTKILLSELLDNIKKGKVQLPDFQRGWVWDDEHVKDLLVSIARSFPVGAVMLLETGGEVRFQTRPIEGVEDLIDATVQPQKLILDGQQRLTTLTQAIALTSPVKTRTSKGKPIQRHYYFDIKKAIESEIYIEDAIVAVDENKQIKSNFGRDIDLDLSTVEKECEHMMFPCDQIFNSNQWLIKLSQNHSNPEDLAIFTEFISKIIQPFCNYQLPVIELKKETSKEAVCLVFEKVNTGGVKLSVFELITASYAADGYNLRDDWLGSEIRNVDSRKSRIAKHPLLKETEAPEMLQAVTILYTYEMRQNDIKEGKVGKQIRPVSAKRTDVLKLPLEAWKKYADKVEDGFKNAAQFLRKEYFYARSELPYSTQVIPLAAVMSVLGNRWLEPKIYEKLARWYWCGVLGELYGGAVETRIANDFEELLAWFEDNDKIPRTIIDAFFQPERLYSLRSRNSAAYKAINILILREGAKDWFWNSTIQELDAQQELALDIHHIFPIKWCEDRNIDPKIYNCILNKTSISYKANRKIGGDAPSVYLQKIQNEKQVSLSDDEMDKLLSSHSLSPDLLRNDDFDAFISDRQVQLIELISKAMGKDIQESHND
ncbi:GmrSD restriction endonuclease domain-containing protein [Psychrobacter sanguinis]|uniref:DUF262 domain-containing protein n=1 Tax=Psychrobacter sanguinis TaxID=861445 RepID=A0A844M0S4_9GAMM|nr:DUF262 domain-containing protein [Psychrobacter sanguinis]MUG32384.1 DUF262 domain-containing protein [Psychrobacter sanguinis]